MGNEKEQISIAIRNVIPAKQRNSAWMHARLDSGFRRNDVLLGNH